MRFGQLLAAFLLMISGMPHFSWGGVHEIPDAQLATIRAGFNSPGVCDPPGSACATSQAYTGPNCTWTNWSNYPMVPWYGNECSNPGTLGTSQNGGPNNVICDTGTDPDEYCFGGSDTCNTVTTYTCTGAGDGSFSNPYTCTPGSTNADSGSVSTCDPGQS